MANGTPIIVLFSFLLIFFFLLVFSNVGVVLVNLKKSYLFPIDIYRVIKQ